MKNPLQPILILAFFACAADPLLAEDTQIWQIGTFDDSVADLTPFEDLPPDVWVRIDPATGEGANFPTQHSPPDDDTNPDNANEIDVWFAAPAGNYVLRVGQLATVEPETVDLSLDGSNVGSYTTSTDTKTHEVSFAITDSGEHILTFEGFTGGNGYRFDAVELVTQVDGLIVYPESLEFTVAEIGSGKSLTIYGGIGDYSLSTTGVVDASLYSTAGVVVQPKATGTGTVVVTDQAANRFEVRVTVYDAEIRPTVFDPADNSVEMPSVTVAGDSSGQSFNTTATLYGRDELINLLEQLDETDAGSLLYLVITGVGEN